MSYNFIVVLSLDYTVVVKAEQFRLCALLRNLSLVIQAKFSYVALFHCPMRQCSRVLLKEHVDTSCAGRRRKQEDDNV